MAALTVSEVRTRISTAVGSITGWTESKSPYSSFGRDPSSIAHRVFSVGIVRTLALGDRQHINTGSTVKSTAAIRFLYRLRPKDQVADYGQALDAEHDIIKACMAKGSAVRADLQVIFAEVPIREVDDAGEWFMGEVHFDCTHLLALA